MKTALVSDVELHRSRLASTAAYCQTPSDFNQELSSVDSEQLFLGARPFIACSLPIRRLPPGCLEYRRRNGRFLLEVIGRPESGVPFGQDRLVLFYLVTLASRQNSRTVYIPRISDMLAEWQMPSSGTYHQRLKESFQRVLNSRIYFGTDNDLVHGTMWEDVACHSSRQHEVTLTQALWRELREHPVPFDRRVVRELATNPGCLDVYAWLKWRCRLGSSPERVPLFGPRGLQSHLGVQEYARQRKFRERINDWLESIRVYWPGCPAKVATNGAVLEINTPAALEHGEAMLRRLHRRRKVSEPRIGLSTKPGAIAL